MRKFTALCCLFLVLGLSFLGGACENPEKSLRFSVASRPVIGGKPNLQLPAVGALTRDDVIFCSATLIAPRVVLTAGHCTDSAFSYAMGKNKLRFRVDTIDAQAPHGYKTHYFAIEPHLLQRHPQWRSSQVLAGYDVGIAILQQPVPNKIATPIPYNETALIPSEWTGKEMLFLGYGLIASVPYAISPNRKFGARLRITKIQADRISIHSPNKSICHGDSGGPALAQIKGQWRVLAVNSYAQQTGFAQGSKPPRTRCDGGAVSVRTDAYKAFLRSWVNRFKQEAPRCKTDDACGTCGRCSPKMQACEATPIAKNAQHCKPCNKDTDCGKGACLTLPEGKRCVATCGVEGCCPDNSVCTAYPQTSGSSTICKPWNNRCPNVSCTQNRDCSDLETCDNGVCKRQQVPAQTKQCFPCQSNIDCDSPNLLCDVVSGEKRCLQRCEKADACPQGFLCQAGGPGQTKRCIATKMLCPILCQNDGNCPASWRCQSQRCQPQGQSDENESCKQRPCKAGLSCVATLDGRRCMRPCAVPVGAVGGACKGERDCNKGAYCLTIRGRKHKYCAAECKTSQDCQSGGSCHLGYCLCRSDQECKTDSICEKDFGSDTGFCVEKSAKRRCPSNQTCQYFTQGSYCITPKALGRRWIGQSCDKITPCQEGLGCIEFGTQAGICTEICRSNTCRLGGNCQRGYCFCRQTLDCPKGRVCQRFIERRNVWTGICIPAPGAVVCQDTKECNPGQRCDQGRCTSQTTEESRQEPDTNEETKTQQEPITESNRDAGATPSEQKDGANLEKISEGAAQEELAPPRACGCSTKPSSSSPIPVGGILLCVLCLGLARRYLCAIV